MREREEDEPSINRLARPSLAIVETDRHCWMTEMNPPRRMSADAIASVIT